jgi:hypothetical protein
MSSFALVSASLLLTTLGKFSSYKVVDPGPFDIATCSLNAPPLPDEVDEWVLKAVLLSSRPLLLECLTPGTSRRQPGLVSVQVSSSFDASGVTNEVRGEDLTESGTRCVQLAVDGWTQRLLAGKKPSSSNKVQTQIVIEHRLGDPNTQMGKADVNDVVGRVRLAMPNWCDCFAPLLDQPPPPDFMATIRVGQSAGGRIEVKPALFELETPENVAPPELVRCLKDKIMATSFFNSAIAFHVPLHIELLNSNVTTPLSNVPITLRAMQLLVETRTLEARLSALEGARAISASRYAERVEHYNRRASQTRDASSPAAVEETKQIAQELHSLSADCEVLSRLDAPLLTESKRLVDLLHDAEQEDPATASAADTDLPDAQRQLSELSARQAADQRFCSGLAQAAANPVSHTRIESHVDVVIDPALRREQLKREMLEEFKKDSRR